MRRIIITFLCVMMLAMGWRRASGFALLGPAPFTAATGLSGALPSPFPDAWQVVAIGYGFAYTGTLVPGGPVWLGDLGGPKNIGTQGSPEDSIGEGYRRNDPVLYYAYDANFNGFFTSVGESNVDKAFAIMNNVFTNHANGVDGYSANLSEFPFNSQHFNGIAQGLYLTDIKSVTLHLLVEQMGLAEPERYTWTLHDRSVGGSPPPCPENVTYIVVQRNFGLVDQPLVAPQTGTLYSPYVNNILYTYGILEDCGHHGPAYDATTVAFSTDTTSPEYTAVAANNFEGGAELGLGGLQIGGFYTGLTEDDAEGLRYLMSSNSYAYENPAFGSLLEQTNFSSLNVLQTSDLAALLSFAQTNPPAVVSNAFPGLVIDTVSNYPTLVSNPVIASYFTNYPGSPAGSLPVFVVKTNSWTFTVQTNYAYTFDNVVIVNEHTNTVAHLTTVSLAELNGAPAGTGIYTNTTAKNIVLTNVISGDYYIVPPGSCGFDFVKTLLKNYRAGATTNVIATATNILTGFVASESIVTYFTNNWYEYFGCNLETSGPAFYQGIQHIQFVRVADGNVDPLTGTFNQPITSTYTMTMLDPTNGQLQRQTFQRMVTAPDILLTASDQAAGPEATTPFNGTVRRNIFFEVANILPGLSGPGVIDRQSVFDYNKVGTVWWNGPFPDTNSFLPGPESEVNETTATPGLLWASFDGTTNAPIVYPSSTLSVQELESQMIITVSPMSLPDGTNGLAYTPTAFTATGGTPPYTWSADGLPNGLVLVGNVLEGIPNGNTNGVDNPYDVTVKLTDSSFPTNVVLTDYTITIH